MGRPTFPDAGVSSECTCTAWSGSGQRYGCNLCALGEQQPDGGPPPVQCLLQGGLLPLPEGGGGCSAAGGSAALGLLAVLGVLLFCRRRK